MKNLFSKIPESSGVYLMKDAKGEILYVGKAGNLRRRVSSYFQKSLDARLTALVGKIKIIDYKKTDTAFEALILESKLIKKHSPPFNIREKDDKSFLYVEITKDFFPRVLLVRGKSEFKGKGFGPFTSASAIREALRILRRIFPWSTHSGSDTWLSRHGEITVRKERKPCFDYQIGLCPGVCIGAISRTDYLKNIKNVEFIFQGKKKAILKNLKKEMKLASKNLEFEKAEKLKRQIFALGHIQDIALINDSNFPTHYKLQTKNYRIEGYDISNISGTSAVGSMAVFINNEPAKSEYRKFKIRTISKPNDVGMLEEVLRRRFKNSWPLPNLILVDGGIGQVNSARKVLAEFGLKIPVLGIAKGAKRKNNKIVGGGQKNIPIPVLIQVRDEAHRFAVGYHKKLRGKGFLL